MKNKISFLISLPLIHLVSILPDRLFYLFSDFIAFVLRDVLSYRKAVVLENLRSSFPGKIEEELHNIMHTFYLNLADTLLESLKMGRISRDEIGRRFYIEGAEHLEAARKENRTAVIVTGHYANWEWAGLAISAGYPKSPITIVYQSMSNKHHENYFNRLRAKFGAHLVSMKGVLREVMAHRHEPGVLVLVSDQAPSHSAGNHQVQFLNHHTSFYPGAAKLAQKIDGVLLFAEINRSSRGHYTLKIVPLVHEAAMQPVQSLTEAHVHYLEQVIQNKPSDWLWSHKRWKQQTA